LLCMFKQCFSIRLLVRCLAAGLLSLLCRFFECSLVDGSPFVLLSGELPALAETILEPIESENL